MKSIVTLVIICFLHMTIVSSQTVVKGLIKDDLGAEVVGANVFIKGTYDGTSSSGDGTFNFKTSSAGDQILVVSYIGFKDYETPIALVGEPLNVSIKLQPTAANLKEIVISAGAFEASDEKKGVVLNSLDIVTTAGALADIAGALNTLPGTQKVGETGQLFVRGGSASEARTFIDGMRVQNPYSNTVPDVPSRGRFSPFLFKGTIFSTGGYSAEYGQALSSALILNSTDLATETSTGISLMSIGGGLSHTHAWEKTSVSLSANYMNLGPYINLVPQEREWERPFSGGDAQLILRHKTSETGMLKLHTNYSSSGLKFGYADLIDIGQTNSLELLSGNFYLNSTYKEVLGDKWSLMTGFSYSKDDRRVEELFFVESDDQTTQGKITLTNYTTDNVTLKFGIEHLYNVFDEQFIGRDERNFESRLEENYSAAFMESDIYFSRRLAAKVGVRLERSGLLDAWNTAPRLSLAYRVGLKSQISLAYGKFYQTPVNELLKFNQNIGFENATHYIANFQHIKNDRIFRIEGYYKQYDNLVKYPSSTQWQSNNNGDGFARGIDVFFRDRKTVKSGDYWISYSYLDTERDYLDYPETATPFFASSHNTSVVYKHWINKITSSVGVTYSFASGRPYNDPNTTGFNSERTKAFQDLSFSASYLTNIKGQFTVAFISVSNVLGFDNTFGYRFAPTPGNDGKYPSYAVKPDAKRFFFIGMFVSIGRTFDKDEQVKPD